MPARSAISPGVPAGSRSPAPRAPGHPAPAPGIPYHPRLRGGSGDSAGVAFDNRASEPTLQDLREYEMRCRDECPASGADLDSGGLDGAVRRNGTAESGDHVVQLLVGEHATHRHGRERVIQDLHGNSVMRADLTGS